MPTRRARIVCISDTHNQTPKLPSGDILIHAGDLTNQGTYSELQKTISWLQQTEFQLKIVVCGNHDVTCDIPFYQQYGAFFHNKRMEDPQRCIDLFQADPSIVYLNHEARDVQITYKGGAVTKLKVFGSPYSPAKGFWAFGYIPENASRLWDQIPLDSDIVVTHTPAKFHRDEYGTRGAAGCERLREALWRVRPRLFVCGHVHEAYGVEAVTWDLSSSDIKFKEQSVRHWKDPRSESKKQFAVDLTSRVKSMALQNDGCAGSHVPQTPPFCDKADESDIPADNVIMSNLQGSEARLPAVPAPPQPPFPEFEKSYRPIISAVGAADMKHTGTRGQGGPASSPRTDREAISGREGRIETCIVNAAFMATNWPHRGGKKFHKPIVIDIDLPVLENAGQASPPQSS
ncbi:uncharacterized protein Z518_07948 [Rhinocladiella mackenziei CBS 650.93]|uniref:Calcineurin-like phosphoesterase domain-containing protein n=1 Tax=Rhinocladiella mackenziei CBS 650.93 TaxID=1442369 RepID=A0A0D2I855_9EURO|nr:uncharacterized protein Z518_07948 [Rhinocladiella mackenziei CBS 650.93]KIX02009.1 hypothetical protein Z518_07948 [Rhinocladiella mackenziei CBS 650.93]